MCFIVHPGYNKVSIALKDIPCWKLFFRIGGGYYRSIVQARLYKLGNLERAKKNLKVIRSLKIKEGGIWAGIHSFMEKDTAKNSGWSYGVIVECIIPKGTKYFYNPKIKEYVSLAIILIKEVSQLTENDNGREEYAL
jgi:hypothetical protein